MLTDRHTRLGPYRVIEEIGHGGMGVVFLGEDDDGREVALKSLEEMAGTDLGALRAIRREVELLKTLRHPHIVGVIDTDLTGPRPWYAMEYVAGRSLSARRSADPAQAETLIDTPLPTAETPTDPSESGSIRGRGIAGWDGLTRTALGWVAQVAHALAYLHGEGLIHGDLKPHNIVVSGQRAVLIDFGLADRVEGRITLAGLRRARWSARTPAYASPECLRSERLDPRADLYSMGCIIYEIVAGRLPFEGSAVQVMYAHGNQPPTPLTDLVDGVPVELDELVMRLMAKDRRDRSAHALDIVSTLESIGIEAGLGQDLPEVRPYLYSAPIVGREHEVAALAERVRDDARRGTVLISGAAGVGKSTLALEAVRAGRDQAVRIVVTSGTRLRGDSDHEAASPFAAFSGVFDEIVDFATTASDDEVRSVLGTEAMFLAPFEPRLEPWREGEAPVLKDPIGAACRALETVLGRMCAAGGLMLVCDELQWFDAASMRALRRFVEGLADRGGLVMAMARSDEFELEAHEFLVRHADVIELEPLDVEETGRSLAGMLGAARVDDPVADLVHKRCEGNPYYIRELLDVALVEGAIELRDDGVWTGSHGATLLDAFESVPEPETIVELTRRRLAALDPQALRVAHHAAIIGREFSVWLLSDALGAVPDSALDRALNTLQRRGVVEPTAGPMTMRFAHDRLRESLLDWRADDEDRAAHLAVARAMEVAGHDAAVIAWHYERAGELQDATGQWLGSADQARRRQSNEYLSAMLGHAIRTGETVLSMAQRNRLRAERVEALVNMEDHPSAIAEARRLLAEPDLPTATRAWTLTSLARSLWRTGELDESLVSTSRALNSLNRETDPELFAKALGTHADALDMLGRNDEAAQTYQRALEIAEKHDLLQIRSRTLNNLGLLYRGIGEYEKAAGLISLALECARAVGDRWREALFQSNLGLVYGHLGQYDAALAEYAGSMGIGEELADEYVVALNQHRLGLVHRHRSNFPAALRFFGLAEEQYERSRMEGALGCVLVDQALVRSQQGFFDTAETLARRALTMVEGKFRGDEVYALHVLGCVQRHVGRWGDAGETLAAALELATEIGSEAAAGWTLSELSMLASDREDGDEALELATRALEKLREGGSATIIADARFAEGVALRCSGEPRQALEVLTEVYETFVEQERPWFASMAASQVAGAAREAGDEGETWLARAAEQLDGLAVESAALPRRAYQRAREAQPPRE